MKVAVVGIGLIGGSMAISLKESAYATKIIGVDKSQDNLDKAIRRRLIDIDLPLEEAIKEADMIILATPVNVMIKLLPKILDQVDRQVVMDVGSTKAELVDAVKDHPQRKNYVATHPMSGTEFSGPEAAIPQLFDNRVCVLCNLKESHSWATNRVIQLYEAMNMRTIELEAEAHDIHAAYVSHISHISSFALALTVLEKEKDENRIFEMASGGFSSTVRLAKSSPEMWVPIFEQNRDNVLDVLDEHINTLARFRSILIKKDFKRFHKMIEQSNQIKKILK